MITNPRFLNKTSNENTTTGSYYFNIHGNDGFMCNRTYNDSTPEEYSGINQHAADLLCQSLGYPQAEEGLNIDGTPKGWYTKGEFFGECSATEFDR